MYIEFVLFAISILVSLFLSGSETALMTVNRTKVQLRAEQGDKESEKLLALLSKPDRMIITILVGNTIANISMAVILILIAEHFAWHIGWSITILTVFIILFCEVLPKTIAATFSDRVVYVVSPLIRFLVILLRPITAFIAEITNLFIRIGSKGAITETTITKEELLSMVDLASTDGTFEDDESERIKGMLDFPNKDVSDVLSTHRTEVVGIPMEATYEDVRDTILEHHYTRYPVYDDSLDTIVGMFYSKKFIEWSMDTSVGIDTFIDKDPLFVVQTLSVEKVFKLMLTRKKHMAVVLDEYGGTLGIVTHEDLIEEMIGQEIEDETDNDEEILVHEMTESRLVCAGRMEIEEVNSLFNISIVNENETIGGFVLDQLGHVPEENEQFAYENLMVEINEMDRSRIVKLTITKREEVTEPETEKQED
ncbi:Hemolysin, contains CBS domains [Psychrobacillus psychrotolerans]|uniref:Hemolysin, contains CBS domains n=1 Tax=Psychrobacillus psychrotolerans TaxID=126156 RepID=A0A1I5XJD8_9BACI|nr:hemolysin family protein [Psychrobacillus psychrotolerans]SFQ32083.1 Hemolysin, contains CBS domains [Psychrobacillus psychrotolerans]